MEHEGSNKGLKVGMIDADLIDGNDRGKKIGTKHPNLAQIKMSAYCKLQNNVQEVKLLFDEELNNLNKYDLIIVSKVFNFTKLPKSLEKYIPNDLEGRKKLNIPISHAFKKAIDNKYEKNRKKKPVVAIGGTGFFPTGGNDLECEIEHIMPDYELYHEFVKKRISQGYQESRFDDYLYFSIGFTTRGCFRHCSFCVNKKYNRVEINSPISEFLNPNLPKIYLWDDNFLGYGKGWEQILNDLNMTGKPFQFRQGLDIRLMTDKKARIITQSNWHGDFIFAFDHINDEELIIKRLRTWKKYYDGVTKLYVLCSYAPYDPDIHPPGWAISPNGADEVEVLQDIEDTFKRISILMQFGCLPYIMRYETWRNSKYRSIYVQLARWCNQPQFFKKMSFRQFCERHLLYCKNVNNCLPYNSMIKFEKEHPEIAKKYYDLKFENVCKYDRNISYSRIKHEPCSACKKTSVSWIDCIDNQKGCILSYLSRTLDLNCLRYATKKEDGNTPCSKPAEAANSITRKLLDKDLSELIEIVACSMPITSIKPTLVPRINNFEDCTYNLLKVLHNDKIDLVELGHRLKKKKCSDQTAYTYAKSCAEVAALLDLIFLDRIKKERKSEHVVSITAVGTSVLNKNKKERKKLYRRLSLRIPIVQQYIIRTRILNSKNINKIIPEKDTNVKINKNLQSLYFLIDLLKEEIKK